MTDFEERSGSAFLASMRRAHDPPADAKQRVRAAVLAGLPLTVPPAVPAPSTTAASASGWTSVAGVAGTTVVVLGIAIGAFYMLRPSANPVPAQSPRVVVTATAPELSAAIEEPPIPDAVEAVPAARISPRPLRLAPSSSAHTSAPASLPREVELVRAAHVARENGDPTTALARLASHRRDFPRGMLVEEREVETVLALCALGRDDEARAKASAFEATFPSSAHAGRVAASCAAPSERSRHEPTIDRALTP